jgi:hypothetical protein
MAEDDLMKIRITADFKEAEGAFLKMAKVATSFESDFRRIAGGLNKEFNKINGMAQLFGNSTNVVKDKMDALKRSMEQLMTLGLQPMNPEVQKLKAQYDGLAATLEKTTQAANKTSSAIEGTAAPAKNSNKQMMSLALILQDLPYGFRGIQNNLPALFGSIAGVAGVGYLAFSAIIAGLTFWDEHNRKVAASTKKLKEEQDAVLNTVTNEAVKVNELIVILENENETRDRKKRALKELQGINPDIFKDLKLEGDSVKNLNTYYNAYIENLKNIILLKKYEKDLEALIQADLKTGQPIKVQEQKSLKKTTDLLTTNNAAVKDNINTAKVSYGKDQNIIKGITNYNKRQQDKLDLLEKIRKISPSISLGGGDDKNNKKGGKTPEEVAKEKARLMEIANESETKAFINLLDERAQKEYKAGLELAENLEKMKAAGYTDSTTYYSAYRQNMLNITKEYDDKEAKEQEKRDRDAENAANKINDRNLQNALTALKIESDVATKIANFTGKTEADRIAILENYKNKLYDLASIGGYTAEQFDKIEDAIIRVDAAIAGSMGVLKNFEVSMVDVTNSLNTIIYDVLQNLAISLGETIGNVLAKGGGIKDVLNGFLGVLADGLIQVGKLAIGTGLAIQAIKEALKTLNPYVAVAAGVALVALGTYVKGRLSDTSKNMSGGGAKAFADGGIISGPTMGLMGEYPGAKSNPEVVAPLDKLKNLIGGSGGTLEARISGNDLLILMNKAQRNNNTTF